MGKQRPRPQCGFDLQGLDRKAWTPGPWPPCSVSTEGRGWPNLTTSWRNQGQRRSETSSKYPRWLWFPLPFPGANHSPHFHLRLQHRSPQPFRAATVPGHPIPSPLSPFTLQLLIWGFLGNRTPLPDVQDGSSRSWGNWKPLRVSLGLQQASGQAGTQIQRCRLQVSCPPRAVHCSLSKTAGCLSCSTNK